MPKEDTAPAPEPRRREATRPEQAAGPALLGPFGIMASLAGLATFYLSPFVFPFLLSAAGALLGFVGWKFGQGRPAMVALALGVAGLALEIIALAVS